MTVVHVEVLVEEQSMEIALRKLLPRLLNGKSFEVYPFQGKEDLLKHLPNRLSGYRVWLPEDWRIVVVVDRDKDDCMVLKDRLEEMALINGFSTKSKPARNTYEVVNRIAVEELEAWYFGDWDAVRRAYPKASPTVPQNAKYRQPDAIRGGTWEAFERIMQKAGYFKNGLRKVEAARCVAEHFDPNNNSSPSFCIFCDALRGL